MLVFVLAFSACENVKEKQKAEISAMQDTAIAAHDRVMPEMGKVLKYSKKAKMQMDSLSIDTVANALAIQQLDSLYRALEQANRGMMDWMRNYKTIADTTSFETAKAYMEDQITSVKKVEADILGSIKKAEDLLH